MINTTVNSKELFRNLAIIYRDIVWACKGTVNKYIIVRVLTVMIFKDVLEQSKYYWRMMN